MRKPVSKNALRRAFDKAMSDGQIQCTMPVNAVVDRIWHDMERENYNAGRKKPTPRTSLRGAGVADVAEVEVHDS